MRKSLLLAAALTLVASSFAQEPAMQAAQTDVNQQTDIAVTAYNSGIALVRDVRKLDLPQGEVELKFMDVAQQIRPETVGLRSLAQAGSVVILEQNYEYDLISPQKLMEKYVGKEVKLINFSTEIGFYEKAAELLSINEGPVFRIEDQIFLGHPGNVVVPEIPDNLIAKPSLIWQVRNNLGAQELEATYITGGISWKADYVLTLAKTDKSLDISGWVTMDKQSGATYENAALSSSPATSTLPRAGRGERNDCGSGRHVGASAHAPGRVLCRVPPLHHPPAHHHQAEPVQAGRLTERLGRAVRENI